MKNQISFYLAVVLTAAVMAFAMSCKDKDIVLSDELSVSPSEREIVFEIDGVNAKAGGEPFNPTFTVTTNQDSIYVVRGKPWIKVTPLGPAGPMRYNSFSLSADPVDGIHEPEDGWVWVSAGRAKPVKIVVTQLAQPRSLEVEPSTIRNITFGSDGKTATSNGISIDAPPVFTVITNVETWEIKSDQPWLTYDIDGDTFTLTASVNLSLDPPEEATVTVTAEKTAPIIFKVNQEGGNPIIEMTGMNNEYTLPGEIIKIYGNFLLDKENTVIYFGDDIQTPVIENGGTYLTARVPENVQPNVKVRAVNSTYDLEATCPGFYQDKNNVITTFDDDFPYTGIIGPENDKPGSPWGSLVEHPGAIGKCLAFIVDCEVSREFGWWYLMGDNPITYTQDMKDNPGNYVLKFELVMQNAITNSIEFYIYYSGGDPVMLAGGDLSMMLQELDVWQTISIPLENIISANAQNASMFNIRPQCFWLDYNVNIHFDNFRIYKKGD